MVENNNPLNVELVPIDPMSQYLEQAQQRREDIDRALELEREQRVSELQQWASEKKVISRGAPRVKDIKKVRNRLRAGMSLVKSIRGVCSIATWNRWKEEYPAIAAIEEQANAEAVDMLLDKKLRLADQPDRTKMGEIARDKIHMDELQNRIDRIDRLTENRNKKNSSFGGSVIPIQINVGYGKPKTN